MNRRHWAFSAMLAAMVGGGAAQSWGQDAAPDAGALFQRLDKDGDGKLTKGEIPEEQTRIFERLLRRGDKNSDGALTREEFVEANRPEERPDVPPAAPGAGPDQARVDARQRFEMLDRNKDGKVTLEEFPEQARERMKPLFERLGKDALTLEEFSRFAGGGGGFRPDPNELFRQFDKNGDGKLGKAELPAELRERFAPAFERAGKDELTREDFQRVAGPPGGRGNPEEMFERIDANKDGKLTVDEAPEPIRPLLQGVLRRAGKEPTGSLTKEEFIKNFAPREGDRRPDGDRPRDGARPGAEQPDRRVDGERPRDGERRPEGDRPRDGERRPDAERPRDGDRPAAERPRDGARRPEADRPRDGERRPEGDRPRDGERRPEGDRPREGGPAIMRILDKNRDGRISKEELAQLANAFEELDRNKDGHIDPFELIGGPAGPPEGRPDQPRDRGPRDGNPPREDGRRPEGDRPRDGEPRRDGDRPRDGEPRREGDRPDAARRPEGAAANREGRPEAGPFFQRLDRNGDGKISKEEAPEQMKDRFNMLDTNGDGVISLDEFRAGAPQLGDRPRNRQEGRPQPEGRDAPQRD